MLRKKSLEASLLAFDSNNLNRFKKQLDFVYKSGIKNIHYDVADGINVPNVAYGTEWLKELYLKGFTVSVHFMVNKPKKWFSKFADYPFDSLAFQAEPINKLSATLLLKKIKKNGRKCGLAFRPDTDLTKYKKIIKKCDFVTIMGVNPGFGGQEFLKNVTIKNLKLINQIKEENNPNLIIKLDGGVNYDVIKLTSKFVDVYVSGTFLIKQKNPKLLKDFINKC